MLEEKFFNLCRDLARGLIESSNNCKISIFVSYLQKILKSNLSGQKALFSLAPFNLHVIFALLIVIANPIFPSEKTNPGNDV